MTTRKIRVLAIDDSANTRQTMAQMLEADPGGVVIATAPGPFIAAHRFIARELPAATAR